MDDNEVPDFSDDEAALLFRAAGKLMRHGEDATLRGLLEEIVTEDDVTERLLTQAMVADALLEGE